MLLTLEQGNITTELFTSTKHNPSQAWYRKAESLTFTWDPLKECFWVLNGLICKFGTKETNTQQSMLLHCALISPICEEYSRLFIFKSFISKETNNIL